MKDEILDALRDHFNNDDEKVIDCIVQARLKNDGEFMGSKDADNICKTIFKDVLNLDLPDIDNPRLHISLWRIHSHLGIPIRPKLFEKYLEHRKKGVDKSPSS